MSQAILSRSQRAAAVRNHAVDCSGQLEDDELLIGTPTVVPTPAGPTITNVQVTITLKKINGKRVRAGQAIAFTATGGTPGVSYSLLVRCGTDSTPAETIEEPLTLIIT